VTVGTNSLTEPLGGRGWEGRTVAPCVTKCNAQNGAHSNYINVQ